MRYHTAKRLDDHRDDHRFLVAERIVIRAATGLDGALAVVMVEGFLLTHVTTALAAENIEAVLLLGVAHECVRRWPT